MSTPKFLPLGSHSVKMTRRGFAGFMPSKIEERFFSSFTMLYTYILFLSRVILMVYPGDCDGKGQQIESPWPPVGVKYKRKCLFD